MALFDLYGSSKTFIPQLTRSTSDPRPVVVMTCGIAGSGKSTLAKYIVSTYNLYHRLSIDSWVYNHYGLYGTDYPAERYSGYQEEAESALRIELASLLREGAQDVVLDFSFAFRETRDEWKQLVEAYGGRWVLLYLDVEADELRRRVRARNSLKAKDGDSAFPVTEEILEGYLRGFERPDQEGEVVLRIKG
ncbi:hypothetical protein N7532_007526 [Penicillium argentinense]|uniref:P-loop containing nucleoside triphosphate hydrolase protein n=1 Tax=Penicillium argentinense TaxID=1131581 RepID=A0A9W9K734_9EURO|nr:uncharacterized protein N7532_007526 [Penicillium argentinense]KAJ5095235.1 hypothetical protein N7532_007526 [Penicillium argentinense]